MFTARSPGWLDADAVALAPLPVSDPSPRRSLLVPTLQPVLGRHIAQRTVQPYRVVVFHKLCHHSPSILQAQRRLGPNRLLLQGPMIALQLPVGLRIVRAGVNVRLLP